MERTFDKIPLHHRRESLDKAYTEREKTAIRDATNIIRCQALAALAVQRSMESELAELAEYMEDAPDDSAAGAWVIQVVRTFAEIELDILNKIFWTSNTLGGGTSNEQDILADYKLTKDALCGLDTEDNEI